MHGRSAVPSSVYVVMYVPVCEVCCAITCVHARQAGTGHPLLRKFSQASFGVKAGPSASRGAVKHAGRHFMDSMTVVQVCMELMEEFLHVEERFQRLSEATEQEIIDSMRQVGLVLWHCMTSRRPMGWVRRA